MRVLVTGAGGFVGRSVVPRLLAAGHQLVLLGRSQPSDPQLQGVDFHRVDLEHPEQLRRAVPDPSCIDAIVHLAGQVPQGEMVWGPESASLVRGHVRLALTLREAFSDWRGRVVHASSMTVYGMPAGLPLVESAERNPMHPYGLGKLLCEDVLLAWAEADVWALRLPGLFSKSRRGGGLFHFMRAASAGEPIRVTAPHPTPWDVLHVDDAALAVERALASADEGPGAVNVSYGEPVDLLSVAERIAAIAQSSAPIVNSDQVEHPPFQMDLSAARRLLAWPPASLGKRLEQLYRDFGFASR